MLNIYRYIVETLSSFNVDYRERYLEESTDLVDLENRIRNLDRGLAPFQKNYFDHRSNYHG